MSEPITLITNIAHFIAQGDIAQAKEKLTASKLGQQLIHAKDERGGLTRSMGAMIEKLSQFSHNLKRTSQELSTATQEISSSSRIQAGAVQEFTTSSQEIAAAIKQIDTTSQQLSNTMEEISKEAKETATLAGEGRQTTEVCR